MNLHQQAAAIAVFQTALEHILEQGQPCIKDTVCVYRNAKGHGCAFAPCIQDYDQLLEGTPAVDLLLFAKDKLYPWARECPTTFAEKIQNAHDFASGHVGQGFINQFKINMRDIVDEYPELKLSVPE